MAESNMSQWDVRNLLCAGRDCIFVVSADGNVMKLSNDSTPIQRQVLQTQGESGI